jgi:hypothetical protein
MSTLKATPGPWSVHSNFVGPLLIKADAVPEDKGPEIAFVGHADFKTCAANAELIAAAPCLYEALRISTAMLRTLIPPDISVRETLAENERVLARARGETS